MIKQRAGFPRIVIAGTHSGVGKTSVALGLLGALRERGVVVQPFKVGPDFIDPIHLTAVCGRSSRNLDSWMMEEWAILELFHRGISGADLALIEGVMGLYDGLSGRDDQGSTAHLSRLLSTPVILVVDASAMARSIAAVALGFQRLDPRVRIVGVIANRIGGPRHLRLLEEALHSETGLPLLGGLPRSDQIEIPERHLGLLSRSGGRDLKPRYEALTQWVQDHLDLDRFLNLAHDVPTLSDSTPKLFPPSLSKRKIRVAYAFDDAFHFYYQDNLDLMIHRGCDLIPFSPLRDSILPRDIHLIYIGGGYPELFGDALSRNQAMGEDLLRFAQGGGRIYAECGGLMYLSEGITDHQGLFHPMVGILPVQTSMKERRMTLGYVVVEFERDCLLGPKGTQIKGHEFHYSQLIAEPSTPFCFGLSKGEGDPIRWDGLGTQNILASYTHLHFASNIGCLDFLLSQG